MLIRGAIFLAENFVFSDNTIGKKLLALLNNPTSDAPYFLVKTTSQQHTKPKTPGCIENYYQAYFIHANGDFFEKDTWIQLDDYFPFDPSDVKAKLKHIGQLTPKTTDSIVKCFLKIKEQDLSPRILNYLSPPIEQGLQALATKFNNRL